MGNSPSADSRQTLAQRLAAAPPLAKIAALAGWTFAVSVLAQLLLCWLGFQEQFFVQPPRGLAAVTALVGLVALAVADRRPISDYGLAASGGWARQLAGGLALGFVFAAGWYLLCYVSQTLGPRDPVRWKALLEFVTVVAEALIAGFAIQIIFGGYLLSIFRERHGSVTAVTVPAIVLALVYRIDALPLLLTQGEWRRSVGILLMQLLAGVLRLRCGHIMLSTGLLTGIAVVRRMIRKTGALQEVLQPDLALWLCPQGDIHKAPAFWIVTTVTTLILALVVRSRGDAPADRRAGVPASLKRVYPLAMPMTLAPLDVHLRPLWTARARIARDCLPRAMAVLILSTVNTLLSLPERLLTPLFRRRRVLDPVFIVGVHRSGTTHLHNLLALDPNLVAPRHYQVLNPAGALLCGWPLMGLLTAFLPWRRPMDNMPLHVLSPGEEEFAIANLCQVSPYWGWVFPRQAATYDRYLFADRFTPREARIWKRAYRGFLGKLVLWSGRRPVLKNPCNTGRLDLLLEMFPEARIVHIHRHPHDVYRSNLHFAREGQCLFRLQDAVEGQAYADRFLSRYAAMETECYRVAERLPPNRFLDVRFEDLERDPLGEIRRIYAHLELEFTSQFGARLESYLRSIADYRKNRFAPLDEPTRREIERHVGSLMRRWGYSCHTLAQPPSPARTAEPQPRC
jgi:hypothetical protein